MAPPIVFTSAAMGPAIVRHHRTNVPVRNCSKKPLGQPENLRLKQQVPSERTTEGKKRGPTGSQKGASSRLCQRDLKSRNSNESKSARIPLQAGLRSQIGVAAAGRSAGHA